MMTTYEVPDFQIPRGRLLPVISGQVTDYTGPVDLTNASGVRFQMRRLGSPTLTVDSPAVITNAVQGRVAYEWTGTDTSVEGSYVAWFEVTAAGKSFQAPEPPLFVEVTTSRDG